MLDNIKFPYFSSKVNRVDALGLVSLAHFIKSIQNPKPEMKDVFNKISEASSKMKIYKDLMDNEEIKEEVSILYKKWHAVKDDLKQNNLFYVTPCVILDKRGYDYIQEFNEIVVLDIDKIELVEELKHWIFENYKSVICCYTSPSKKGIKVLIRIPKVFSIDEFKSYFNGIGVEFELLKGWDSTCSNCTLPLFMSWDENILWREWEDTEVWTQRGIQINSFKKGENSDVDEELFDENITDYKKNIAKKQIRTCLENVTDNGHGNLVGKSLVAGGYVGAGYLSEDDAEDLLMNAIDEWDYPSSEAKRAGYKKTAERFLKDGISKPLYIDID